METEPVSDAVAAILDARRARRILTPLGPLAPVDPAAGYALQHALAESLGAVPPAGFKIGATTQQMQAYLGLDGPAAGFMEAASLHASGATLPFAALHNPGVECEIGLRLGHDLPAGPCGVDAAAAVVAEVFAAIEVVERRYDDLGDLGTPTLIADQVFHAAGVLGPAITAWQGIDLGGARGELHRNGECVAAGHGRDLLGHPLEALAWLAGSGAAEAFGGLRAGQVVLLGSVTPPLWLDGPARIDVVFDSLGTVTLHVV